MGDDELDFIPPDPEEEVDREPPKTRQLRRGYIEYTAPDGTQWRCDRPEKLLSDYGMVGTEEERIKQVGDWHKAMAPAREQWSLLRRFYRIAPIVGQQKLDDLKEWSLVDLAKSAGVTPRDLEQSLEETRHFWGRKRLEKDLIERASNDGPKTITPDQEEALLEKNGFANAPESEKRYVATRIVEFQHLLDDEAGAHLARSAIMQEMILRDFDRRIMDEMGKEKRDERKTMEGLVEKRNDAQKTYEATLERLGATQEQNPGYRARVQFGDSIGHLVRAVADYYADGTTALIDGMFTEGEIKLLLTPATLRPIQYRPDLVLLADQWKKQFWNPDFEGAKLARKQHRLLLKAFDRAIADETNGEVIDLESDGEGGQEAELESILKELPQGIEDQGDLEAGGASSVERGASAEAMTMPMPPDDKRGSRRGSANGSYGGI